MKGNRKMNISITQNGTETTIALEGRLDTNTSPELEAKLKTIPDDVTALHFDFGELRYVSSAGLRLLLTSQKKMNACGGKMIIHKPNELVVEVFEVTGFSDILTIEK